MNLYLLRHAKAEEHSSRYPSDKERPLSLDGEKEMACVALGMRELELSFDLILSSPFVRARRTAEIVVAVFGGAPLHFSQNLAVGGSSRALIDELNTKYPSCENILLVGHEPYLSKLVSLLTTGTETLSLDFKKAALCKLTVKKLSAEQCATLQWLLPPKVLRHLGKSAESH